MGSTVPDSKTPAMAAFGMVVLGLLIAVMGGFTNGSIAGGLVAGLGSIPACYGMWKGIQQETQTTLALSVTAVLVSLAVGALLILMRIFHWFT